MPAPQLTARHDHCTTLLNPKRAWSPRLSPRIGSALRQYAETPIIASLATDREDTVGWWVLCNIASTRRPLAALTQGRIRAYIILLRRMSGNAATRRTVRCISAHVDERHTCRVC